MKKRIPVFILLLSLIISFFSCEVIYNYDLSVSGLDTLPATKACIKKYIPHSVDAHVGRQYDEIKAAALELDNHVSEIKDSLLADSVNLDNGYNLIFILKGLDPKNEITEVEISKTYFLGEE